MQIAGRRCYGKSQVICFAGTVRLSGARDMLLEAGSDSGGGGGGTRCIIEFYRKRQRRLAARPTIEVWMELRGTLLPGHRKCTCKLRELRLVQVDRQYYYYCIPIKGPCVDKMVFVRDRKTTRKKTTQDDNVR